MTTFSLGDKAYTKPELISILNKSAYRNHGVKHFAKILKNSPAAVLTLDEKRQIFTLRRDELQDIHLNWPNLTNQPKTLTAARIKHMIKMKLNFFNYRAHHLDRMDNLASAMIRIQKNKPAVLEDSSSESASVQKKKSSSIELTQDYLKIFKELLNAMGKISTLVTEVTPPELVSIWYDKDKFTFYIQPEDNVAAALGLVVNQDNTIVFLEVNGAPQDSLEVPEKCLPYLRAACNKFFEVSSNYQELYDHINNQPVIVAGLIEKGVRSIPEYHLDRLITLIGNVSKKCVSPQVVIQLINSSLKFDDAIDAGAITREIFEELMDGILNSRHVSFQPHKLLHFPISKTEDLTQTVLSDDDVIEADAVFASLNRETKAIFGEKGTRKKGFLDSIWKVKALPLSFLNDMEKRIFLQLGQLCMFCSYSLGFEKSQGYSIGRKLDESLFKAIFSLTAKEIDTPFEELSAAVLKKMCEAVIDVQYTKHPTMIEFQWLKIAAHVLDWKTSDPAPEDGYLINAWHLFGLSCQRKAYDYFLDDSLIHLNLEKVKDPLHLERFMSCAKRAVLTADLKVAPRLADYLPVIHQMAKGMKLQCAPGKSGNVSNAWMEKFYQSPYLQFNLKVQGSQDRSLIADLMRLGSSARDMIYAKELFKKMSWLKEWILDEKTGASDEEIAAFLKYTTGSSTVVSGSRITIIAQQKGHYNPVPEGHACFGWLVVAPKPFGDHVNHDRNKTAFINGLRNHALIHGGGGFTTE